MKDIGYYRLEATDQIEKELSALDYLELWDLTLCLALFAVENDPSNESYSVELYEWLDNLKCEQQCKLLRWISDRMEQYI